MPNEDSNPITSRDVRNMERKKRVTEILNEKDFRNELEDVMISQKGEGNRPMFMAGLKMSGSNNSMSGVSEFKGMSGMPERQINDITGSMCDRYSKAERAQRCKLAALYRLTAQFGWDHLIYSHITARVPGEPDRFLINPYGMQYSEITASSLIKVDAEGNIVDPGTTVLPVNKAGFALNTALHSTGANCVYHTHSDAGTAISAMKCGLLNLCQEALQVRPVSYSNYQGFAQSDSEKREVAESLEDGSKVLILRNHGIVSVGKSIEEAFLYMCQLTKACEVQWRTLRCGIEHNLMFESEIAEEYSGLPVELVCNPNGREYGPGELEFESYMRKLDNSGQNTGYPYKMPALFREQLPTYSNVQYPPIVPGLEGPPSDQERSRPNSTNRAAWFKNNAPDAGPPARPAPSKRGIPEKPAKPAKPGQGAAPSRTKLTAFDDIFQTKPDVADSIDPKKRQTVEPGRSPRMERLERELEQLQNKHGRPTSSDGESRVTNPSTDGKRSDIADIESVSDSGSSPSFELMVEGEEVEQVKDAMPIHSRDITTDTMISRTKDINVQHDVVSSVGYSIGPDGEDIRHESHSHEVTTQIIEITEIEEEEFEVITVRPGQLTDEQKQELIKQGYVLQEDDSG